MNAVSSRANKIGKAVSNRIDESITRYEEAYPGRALIQLIPSAGSALDTLLSGRASQIREARYRAFLTDLRADFEQLDVSKVDRAFLESDEFFDWFAATVERVVRTHEAEKVEAVRRVFVAGTTTEHSDGVMKDIALRLAGDLTAGHLRVFKAATEFLTDPAKREALEPPICSCR